MTDSVERPLTPAGHAALLLIAARTGLTVDEVIEAVSREAVRRRSIVVEEK